MYTHHKDQPTNVYGEAVLNDRNARRSVNNFKTAETSADDKPHSRRPVTVETDDNLQRVDDTIRADRRIKVREIVASLNCGHGAVPRVTEV